MSDLIANGSVWVPGSILLASLLGSAHCIGMCGGLVASSCRSGFDLAQYHLGRLLSYSALGALAGALGRAVLGNSSFRFLPWIAALGMGAGFCFLGIQVWRRRPLHFQALPQRRLSFLFRKASGVPLAIGALSALLPCGWLQTFVLGAAATGSAVRGAVFLAIFWLGTVPALTSAPWLLRRALRPFASFAPKVAGALLIFVGLFGIGFKMSVLFAADVGSHPQWHCHSMGQKIPQ